MENTYSFEALLDFLNHASQRGLMPAATATALTVAARNVLGILDAQEKNDLRVMDLNSVIKRFNNKRAKDFNPTSLKEYGQRTRRAVEHFLRWRDDPANFSIKTRTTKKQAALSSKRQGASGKKTDAKPHDTHVNNKVGEERAHSINADGYDTTFPIRPGLVVGITNIPYDLTKAEAERLAQFVKMLALE